MATMNKESGTSIDPVNNGSVDIRGRVADKRRTGGWMAAPFIIVNEWSERLAFFAIAMNIASYLMQEMRLSLPVTATFVNNWMGAAYMLTLLGAFLADAYLGRFRTIVVFTSIYTVGMVLLTISASGKGFRPPPCEAKPCPVATNGQLSFLYVALGLIALGTGGIKPCASTFGADQFDETDKKEAMKKYSFFSWFFFAINLGALLGMTVMVYLLVKLGWGWGFGIPTGLTIFSLLVFLAGAQLYRFQKPPGSPFTRFLQVLVASVKNHRKGVQVSSDTQLFEVQTQESDIKGVKKLAHSLQYRFLDKAAVVSDPESTSSSRWELCTVTQVEEFKSFIRVVPVWASAIALAISYSQLPTFLVSQARLMDRRLGPSFTVPAPSVNVLSISNGLIFIPIYEKILVPLLRRFTGHQRGITSLQRIGAGLFMSVLAMLSAALVEKKRRDEYSVASTVSFLWLLPQLTLIGIAEVLTYVGQLEFFYDEATDGTRSISSALFLSEFGFGNWLSTMFIKMVVDWTGGVDKGWLRNDLNKSRLDYFYWVLTAVNTVNFIVFLMVASAYKGKKLVDASEIEVTAEGLDHHHHSNN